MVHCYVRKGTVSLFAARDLTSGSAIAQPYRRLAGAFRRADPGHGHATAMWLVVVSKF